MIVSMSARVVSFQIPRYSEPLYSLETRNVSLLISEVDDCAGDAAAAACSCSAVLLHTAFRD